MPAKKKPLSETKPGFKAVSKDIINKGHVGYFFSFVGKSGLCFDKTLHWNSEYFLIDNRKKTLVGFVLDEHRLFVKVLLDDGRIGWTKKTSLLHLLLSEDRTSGDELKGVLAEKIEELSKPESQGLSISDTKEILTKCLAELSRSKPVPDESSK